MSDDASNQVPDPLSQNPKPRPKFNSLDGFTNNPKPVGPSSSDLQSGNTSLKPVSLQPNGFTSKPAGLQPGLPQTMAAQNPQPLVNSIGIGGVAKPTVTGLPSSSQSSLVQPMQTPDPTAGGQPAAPFAAKKKSKKKLWLFLIVLFVLLLLGAGYAFAF